MKWIKGILLLVVVLLIGMGALQWAASETTGEVVVLTSTDAEGNTHETRLWVVDSDGAVWLRAGQDGAGWYQALAANASVSMTRNGETRNYKAIAVPAATATVNGLMGAKYGWGDRVIGQMINRSRSVAIRLEPHS